MFLATFKDVKVVKSELKFQSSTYLIGLVVLQEQILAARVNFELKDKIFPLSINYQ